MQIRWGKVPKAREFSRFGRELSRPAQLRLQWMSHYLQHGRNATFTCRHFGISRQTFYRWWRRYDPHDLSTLEDHSHRPHRRRQPAWNAAQAQAVLGLRREYPRWCKDKLVVLPCRKGLRLSTSMVGRILGDLKRRGVLIEAPAAAAARKQRKKLHGRPWDSPKASFWAHSATRRSGATRHQRTAAAARYGAETLLRAQCGLALGCAGSARTGHFVGRGALPGHPCEPHAAPHRGSDKWTAAANSPPSSKSPASSAACRYSCFRGAPPKLNGHVSCLMG
ncbi:MAG TPA: helix-turn-helix domain-containing protein [Candidatus Acidoferrales bacterium]|nr:helix-turn-helix domain-containing protein [Candidatus Acidoferrales bacterium]